MSLRYKGVPDRGANRQVDDLPSLCFCKFVAVGVAMAAEGCPSHDDRCYPCEAGVCTCQDYRPNTHKLSPLHWPRCVCGHIAQEHN